MGTPLLALDPQGVALAVWVGPPLVIDSSIFNRIIWTATAVGGVWSDPELLRGGGYGLSHLAMDDSGRALLLGTWFIARSAGVFTMRYEPGFGWEVVPSRGSGALQNDFFGAFDLARDGSAIVIFLGEVFTPLLYHPGSGWEDALPFVLSDPRSVSGNLVSHDVAIGREGDAWIAWPREDGLVVSHYGADIGWEPAELLVDLVACPEQPVGWTISADARGGATLVWAEGAGCEPPNRIRAVSFD